MSKLRLVVIDAEGDDVAYALEQFAACFSTAPVTVETRALPVATVKVATVKRAPVVAKAERQDTEDRDAQILSLLKFRPLRIPEIADGLCDDKRQVKVMTGRLYPAMAKLLKQGKVKKDGSAWAVK